MTVRGQDADWGDDAVDADAYGYKSSNTNRITDDRRDDVVNLPLIEKGWKKYNSEQEHNGAIFSVSSELLFVITYELKWLELKSDRVFFDLLNFKIQ